MKIIFLLKVWFLPFFLCDEFATSYDYSNLYNSSFQQQNEINSDLISAYGDYPYIAPDQSKSKMDYFATSVNIFQSIESVLNSLPILGSERRFATVSGNIVYNDLVKSGEVVRIIIVLTLQLVFTTIGWFFTSLFWSQLRGQEVDWDPDFRGAITDGLLDSNFAATELAVGGGAVGI